MVAMSTKHLLWWAVFILLLIFGSSGTAVAWFFSVVLCNIEVKGG